MKSYTTETAIENYTLQNIDPTFSSQIESWIESVEDFIDNYTERNFKADTSASIRKYDGDGEDTLLLDDFIEITGLTNEGTEVESTAYYTYPANTTRKNKIVLDSNVFIKGKQNIEVTAKWGYSIAVPADITLAATILAVGIVNYSSDAKGKVRSESIGRYTVTYKDEKQWSDYKTAMQILKHYRDIRI